MSLYVERFHSEIHGHSVGVSLIPFSLRRRLDYRVGPLLRVTLTEKIQLPSGLSLDLGVVRGRRDKLEISLG